MPDRRRFLKGLTVPWGRKQPVRRPTTLSRHIALHEARIGHLKTFSVREIQLLNVRSQKESSRSASRSME